MSRAVGLEETGLDLANAAANVYQRHDFEPGDCRVQEWGNSSPAPGTGYPTDRERGTADREAVASWRELEPSERRHQPTATNASFKANLSVCLF